MDTTKTRIIEELKKDAARLRERAEKRAAGGWRSAPQWAALATAAEDRLRRAEESAE